MPNTYRRNLRHGLFARLRHQRKFLAFLAAQDTRLTTSATASTIDTVDVAAAAGVGTLTFGANAANTKTVTIGSTVYTFKTALTEAKASDVYTVGGGGSVIQDADTMTLNGKVYTWQTVLTNVDGHVLIGANDTAALLNMLRAITLGAGSGTLFAAATTAHPTITATASNATTLTVKAILVGVAGNSLTATESSNGAFATVTLLGGVAAVANEIVISGVNASGSLDALIAAINAAAGVGTTYSTGTVAHPSVGAAAGAGDTMDITALTAGLTGNSVALATDVASASWGNAFLTGGATASFGPNLTSTAHGITDGEGPYIITSSGNVPGGYTAGTLVWVGTVDADTIAVARSRDQALDNDFMSFTTAGTGTISLTKAMTSGGIYEMLRRNKPRSIVAATDVDSLR